MPTTPPGAVANQGIQPRRALELLELRRGFVVLDRHQRVDQGDLHHRRLLGLQRIDQSAPHVAIVGVAAERFERGQTDVDARIGAQGSQKGFDDLRVRTAHLQAVVHPGKPLTGRPLLQHRKHHELIERRDAIVGVRQLRPKHRNFRGPLAWSRVSPRQEPQAQDQSRRGVGKRRSESKRGRWGRLGHEHVFEALAQPRAGRLIREPRQTLPQANLS